MVYDTILHLLHDFLHLKYKWIHIISALCISLSEYDVIFQENVNFCSRYTSIIDYPASHRNIMGMTRFQSSGKATWNIYSQNESYHYIDLILNLIPVFSIFLRNVLLIAFLEIHVEF